jgi:hypothetical protein
MILLATVYPHTVLAAMGDTGPYLQLAGVLGLFVTIRAGFGR